MPAVNPACYHLSASSVAAFKACPTRFRLAYREGLRPDKDTESQRMGTNWHKLHEIYANAQSEWAASDVLSNTGEWADANEFALSQVINHLSGRYADCPTGIELKDWQRERQVLLTCFIGYLWRWQNEPIEILASEVPFELPLTSPAVNMPLPISEVVRVGKIDHIIRYQGMVGALERKSTSRTIALDSDYWQKAQKDTQVSMYALAIRDIGVFHGEMCSPYRVRVSEGERFANTLYDVWHKPTIKPAMLTQKETAEFIASGEYCGQKFAVENYECFGVDNGPLPNSVSVDGDCAAVEMGKKGFAIRETISMFGARLLADIQERPDFYFIRKEIPRTDKDLEQFKRQLFAVYQSQRLAERYNAWVENEQACRATFTCQYVSICFGVGSENVCDGKTTPAGFRRIFVDLTVNGADPEE